MKSIHWVTEHARERMLLLAFLSRALPCLTARSRTVFIWTFEDVWIAPEDASSEQVFGLRHQDGSPKPAWETVSDFLTSNLETRGPETGCGDGPLPASPAVTKK